jgi:UDP-2,4-diacetamido-2,4,6-trideoxy-beta-L-altropyranose hydrolase
LSASSLVAFRCDGIPATGLGHLSRCLGLAEALEEQGAAVRFFGEYGNAARRMLQSASVTFEAVEGWSGSALVARVACGAAGVVVDSYQIDADAIAEAGVVAPVLVVDDFARLPSYACAAILNFTVAAPGLAYPPFPRRLLGPSYFLVRRSLRRLRASLARPAPRASRVLLSFGGGAWQAAARAALDALLELAPSLAVTVVAGSGEDEGVAARVERFEGGGRVLRDLPDLSEPFAWADACVSGGGLTKYEAAYLGLPVAVLSRTADEASETKRFVGEGLAIDLGDPFAVDRARVHGGLAGLIGDEGLRSRLHEAGRARFSPDPTTAAARAWLEIIKETER